MICKGQEIVEVTAVDDAAPNFLNMATLVADVPSVAGQRGFMMADVARLSQESSRTIAINVEWTPLQIEGFLALGIMPLVNPLPVAPEPEPEPVVTKTVRYSPGVAE